MDAKIVFTKVTPEYEHLEELFDIRDEAFPENERSTTCNLREDLHLGTIYLQ